MSDRGQVPPNGDERWHFRVPPSLARWGLSAWLILGLLALAVVVYFGLAQISSLLVPLVVAIVIGMLFSPVVDRLTRAGLPPFAAASLVLVGLIAITALSIFLSVKGIYDQRDLIVEQFSNGWDMVQVWLAEQGISLNSVDQAVQTLGAGATSGAGGLVQAGLSSVFSFIVGLLIGVFLLFYVLKDWHVIRDWVANHLGQIPPDLGAGIIAGIAVVGAALAVVIYKRDDVGEYVNHEYEHLQNRIHDLEKQLQHSIKS